MGARVGWPGSLHGRLGAANWELVAPHISRRGRENCVTPGDIALAGLPVWPQIYRFGSDENRILEAMIRRSRHQQQSVGAPGAVPGQGMHPGAMPRWVDVLFTALVIYTITVSVCVPVKLAHENWRR